MTDDESIALAVHRALDTMAPAAPGLSAKAVQRVRAERRRGSAERRRGSKDGLRRWSQAAGVLAAAVLVAVAGIAIHQAATGRYRVGPAPIATPGFVVPTAATKGPGAAVAWLDNLTGVDANGKVVGRTAASVALRSPDGNELYALASRQIEVYSASTGKLERTVPRSGSGDTAAVTPDGRYLTILGGNPQAVEVIDLPAGHSVALTRLS